ncbi:acyl-CoA dehydrogenase family protein [Nocardioides marmotae]|uniref:acyl-CoA dehydrogenase family protein n=1 Tax=Nocardioides marmotae TaxID=2663857 RepID=UPI0012B593CD|nr:acyl-CoA dehydrogenase family protein [Nocardioides marmotae]MBC9731789.1 acyl-CoA/acyl-ACP dehydrogenase [Nocardioides marmotae]MTB82911.1 acyl-CoA dehydrogenase [Nocardioides marmotae]
MDFALSEEQQELAAIVRSALAKRADPRVETYDEELWQLLVEQVGVPALGIPEEHGGAGFTLFEALVALEEVGRALVPSPLLSSLVTSEALLAGATEEARGALLPRLAAGEVAAFVDATGGAGPVVTDVLDGDLATVLVAATDDGLWALDPDVTTRAWTASMDQTLRLARVEVEVASATRIGEGPPAATRAALVGAVGVAALQTGTAARALEMTVGYTQERVQFGRPIGSFQALKHRMADMLVRLEMSRSASWAAAYAVSSGAADGERLAHMAKAYCSEALAAIAAETVQLHGGIAITWEHDAHLVLKRAHSLGQLFGTARAHRAAVPLGDPAAR